MDANLKEMKCGQEHLEAEIMADLKIQRGCLTSRIDVNQEKIDAWLKETTACQEATEACLEKA
jgi:hypothetical protein